MKKILFILCMCTLLVSCHTSKITDQLTVPDDTKVILHFSTLTDTTVTLNPKPLSYLYYYDTEGNLLQQSSFKDEIVRDVIIEGKDSMAYLLKNESVVIHDQEEQRMTSDYVIENVRFGPTQSGYLPERDLYFNLLNYGKKSNQPYLSLVRFTSDELYDVAVPYYLENITYHEGYDEFYCIISPLNEDISQDLTFTKITFNENTQQYEWDQSLETCDLEGRFDHPEFEFAFRHTLAANQKLFSVYIADTQAYLDDTNMMKFRTEADLMLSVYDLKTKSLNHMTLLSSYDLGENRYGLLAGHADTPMSIQNDALYVFTTNQCYFKIHGTDFEKHELNYDFEALNLYRPLEQKIYEKEDFFNTVLSIENDDIYVMILNVENQLELYKLTDNQYHKIWTTELPKDIQKNMFLNTFEIINN